MPYSADIGGPRQLFALLELVVSLQRASTRCGLRGSTQNSCLLMMSFSAEVALWLSGRPWMIDFTPC